MQLQKNILSFFNTSLLSCIILCTSELRQELTIKLFISHLRVDTTILLTLTDIFKTCTVVISSKRVVFRQLMALNSGH